MQLENSTFLTVAANFTAALSKPEFSLKLLGPFELTIPLPEGVNPLPFTILAVVLSLVWFCYNFRGISRVRARLCCDTWKHRWVRFAYQALFKENLLRRERDLRHVSAVRYWWQKWSKLSQDLKANRVAKTWQDWSRLGAHIKRHPWQKKYIRNKEESLGAYEY